MPSDDIQERIKRIKEARKNPTRNTRSIYVRDDYYEEIQKFADENNLSTGRLIEIIWEDVREDLET